MMELNELLQGLRIAAHLLTIFIVATYCPDANTAERPGVSIFAVLLAGGSACLAVSTFTNWGSWLELPLAGHFGLTFFFCGLLAPLIAGRGNVATLFPRRVWTRRP